MDDATGTQTPEELAATLQAIKDFSLELTDEFGAFSQRTLATNRVLITSEDATQEVVAYMISLDGDVRLVLDDYIPEVADVEEI